MPVIAETLSEPHVVPPLLSLLGHISFTPLCGGITFSIPPLMSTKCWSTICNHCWVDLCRDRLLLSLRDKLSPRSSGPTFMVISRIRYCNIWKKRQKEREGEKERKKKKHKDRLGNGWPFKSWEQPSRRCGHVNYSLKTSLSSWASVLPRDARVCVQRYGYSGAYYSQHRSRSRFTSRGLLPLLAGKQACRL